MEDIYPTAIPLVQAEDESDNEDFGSRNYRPFNRGNKLKRLLEQPALLPSKPTLWPLHSLEEDYEYVQIGDKRVIVRKGASRRRLDEKGAHEDDPYADIKVEEIWALPDKAEDIRAVEPAWYTLYNRDLPVLSGEAMSIIEREAYTYRIISSFSQMLAGDDLNQKETDLESTLPKKEYQDLVADVQVCAAASYEFMKRLQDIRKRLIKAHAQKKQLSRRILNNDS